MKCCRKEKTTPQHLFSRWSEIQLWKIIKTCKKKNMLLLPLSFYICKGFRVKAAVCGKNQTIHITAVGEEGNLSKWSLQSCCFCTLLSIVWSRGAEQKLIFGTPLKLTGAFPSRPGVWRPVCVTCGCVPNGQFRGEHSQEDRSNQ